MEAAPVQSHLLYPGTLLDERYRIDSVLGEGGFGITYAAENVRIGLKVAIKELFWRGHSIRDIDDSPFVRLLSADDEAVFRDQKERFLREARTIRDFSTLPGVAHILDYFEANGTAYIVMEYVEGETLAAHLKAQGTIPAEALFRLFLPLIDSLGSIHAGGVIHRDVSPDNIMVQPDGSLKLIDFGAARAWRTEGDGKYTAIAKDSYAPGEQYDKNGKQGPWTDVYALCATMYTCLTGEAPVSAVQRLFLDELKTPSEMGAQVEPAYEAVVMRGLEMNYAKRYAAMEELSIAMRAVLPQEKETPRRHRSLLAGILAGLVCIAAALGMWFYRGYAEANKFRGIETEIFHLTAPDSMTAAEFAASQNELKALLEEFAGEDNYLISVDGTQIGVELPLECFGGQEISEVLFDSFSALTVDRPFGVDYELQLNWEDPGASAIAGENQVPPSELTGQTAVFAYGWSYNNLTKGQRANLIMDFKVRLDALGVPYAFGTLYGNDNVIAFRIDPAQISSFVVNSIGGYGLNIAGEHSDWLSISLSHMDSASADVLGVVEYADGSLGLRYEFDPENHSFQNLTASMRAAGEDKLYLEKDAGPYISAIAEASLSESLESGAIEFKTFRFSDAATVTAENRWVVDYVDALLNQTDLPAYCSLLDSALLNEAGETVFGADVSELYGHRIHLKDGDIALRNLLIQIDEETDYSCSESTVTDIFWISLHLDPDERLVENIAAAIPALLEQYDLGSQVLNSTINICCIDEEGDERCRVSLNSSWDYDEERYINRVNCLYNEDSPRLSPYADAFAEWWSTFDPSAQGFVNEDLLAKTEAVVEAAQQAVDDYEEQAREYFDEYLSDYKAQQ